MLHRQVERIMTLRLNGAADEAFPLFGPLREREWDPTWNPVFVAPDAGESCAEGTVFTVAAPRDSVWVMTTYDRAQRRVRYVMVQPGFVTSEVAVDVVGEAGASLATVSYRRTALTDAGERALDAFVEEWPSWAAQWESAVNATLAKRRRL